MAEPLGGRGVDGAGRVLHPASEGSPCPPGTLDSGLSVRQAAPPRPPPQAPGDSGPLHTTRVRLWRLPCFRPVGPRVQPPVPCHPGHGRLSLLSQALSLSCQGPPTVTVLSCPQRSASQERPQGSQEVAAGCASPPRHAAGLSLSGRACGQQAASLAGPASHSSRQRLLAALIDAADLDLSGLCFLAKN